MASPFNRGDTIINKHFTFLFSKISACVFILEEVAQCVISCSGPLTSLIAYDDFR